MNKYGGSMKKKDYAGRPSDERLDCVVRAFTVLTGQSYSKVYTVLKACGRRDGHRTGWDTLKRACRHLGIKRTNSSGSVKRFLKDFEHFPTVAVLKSGHMFAVKYGVVADYSKINPRAHVRSYYTMTCQKKCK